MGLLVIIIFIAIMTILIVIMMIIIILIAPLRQFNCLHNFYFYTIINWLQNQGFFIIITRFLLALNLIQNFFS